MMIKAKSGIQPWLSYFAMLAFGFSFTLIHVRGSSPIYPLYYYGKDSIYYIYDGVIFLQSLLTGQATTNISTLTIIEAFGQIFSRGKPGAFIVEFIAWTCFSMGFWHFLKQFSLKTGERIFIWLTVFSFLGLTIGDGNFGEAYALPISMLLTILIYRDIHLERESGKWGYFVLYGFAFGLLVNLKVIASATICAIIGTEVIYSFVKKDYQRLFQKIAWMALGLLFFVIPYVAYGLSHDNLGLVLSRYFSSGATYAVTKGNTFEWLSRYNLFYFSFLIIPVVLSILTLFLKRHTAKYRIFILFNGLVMSVALITGHFYSHYLMINAMTLIVGLTEILATRENRFLQQVRSLKVIKVRFEKLALTGIALIFALTIFLKVADLVDLNQEFKAVQNPYAEIASTIPAAELDSVLAYNVSPVWYDINQTTPHVDYTGIWMDYYATLNKTMAEHFIAYLDNNPRWVLVGNPDPQESKFMQVLKTRYDSVQIYEIADSKIKGIDGTYELYRLKVG